MTAFNVFLIVLIALDVGLAGFRARIEWKRRRHLSAFGDEVDYQLTLAKNILNELVIASRASTGNFIDLFKEVRKLTEPQTGPANQTPPVDNDHVAPGCEKFSDETIQHHAKSMSVDKRLALLRLGKLPVGEGEKLLRDLASEFNLELGRFEKKQKKLNALQEGKVKKGGYRPSLKSPMPSNPPKTGGGMRAISPKKAILHQS